MTQNPSARTCGNCFHGKMIQGDLLQRICQGAPPQLLFIPTGPGQGQMQTAWPHVKSAMEACALYQAKLFLAGGKDSEPVKPPEAVI